MTRESLASYSCHWDHLDHHHLDHLAPPSAPRPASVIIVVDPATAAFTTTTSTSQDNPTRNLFSPVVLTEGRTAAESWQLNDVSGSKAKTRSDVIGRGEGGRLEEEESFTVRITSTSLLCLQQQQHTVKKAYLSLRTRF